MKVSDDMKAILILLQGAAAGVITAVQNILGQTEEGEEPGDGKEPPDPRTFG